MTSRLAEWVGLLALATIAGGCGQMGPLTLPEEPSAAAEAEEEESEEDREAENER